jgi:hypothetical protein
LIPSEFNGMLAGCVRDLRLAASNTTL